MVTPEPVTVPPSLNRPPPAPPPAPPPPPRAAFWPAPPSATLPVIDVLFSVRWAPDALKMPPPPPPAAPPLPLEPAMPLAVFAVTTQLVRVRVPAL